MVVYEITLGATSGSALSELIRDGKLVHRITTTSTIPRRVFRITVDKEKGKMQLDRINVKTYGIFPVTKWTWSRSGNKVVVKEEAMPSEHKHLVRRLKFKRKK